MAVSSLVDVRAMIPNLNWPPVAVMAAVTSNSVTAGGRSTLSFVEPSSTKN